MLPASKYRFTHHCRAVYEIGRVMARSIQISGLGHRHEFVLYASIRCGRAVEETAWSFCRKCDISSTLMGFFLGVENSAGKDFQTPASLEEDV